MQCKDEALGESVPRKRVRSSENRRDKGPREEREGRYGTVLAG